MTSGPNRRKAIADAAIQVLAERGMRGLTHRAVDEAAGFPAGSTSYYLRTRRALIEAVIRRLADLDQADFEAAAGSAPGGSADALTASGLGPADLDWLAEMMAIRLDVMLTEQRHRTLARYACLLEAAHSPELRDLLGTGERFRTQAIDLLAHAGAPDPERQGRNFVACLDGLLFDRLAGAGALAGAPPGTAESREDLRAAVRTLLHAMTGR